MEYSGIRILPGFRRMKSSSHVSALLVFIFVVCALVCGNLYHYSLLGTVMLAFFALTMGIVISKFIDALIPGDIESSEEDLSETKAASVWIEKAVRKS